MKMELSLSRVSDDDLAALPVEEAQHLGDVSERADTATILVRDGAQIVGYAVFGQDRDDMVTVYAARSLNSVIARAAMKAFLGVAQIMGQPLRVHTDKLRAMARMMGATEAIAMLDGDGLPMGVFSRGQ